jgi:hypothetical protein
MAADRWQPARGTLASWCAHVSRGVLVRLPGPHASGPDSRYRRMNASRPSREPDPATLAAVLWRGRHSDEPAVARLRELFPLR